MTHGTAHQNNFAHGYVLLHLIATGDAAAAVAAINARHQPDVKGVNPVSDSVLVYVEPTATAHNTAPEKQAAHARFEALETMFMNLTKTPGGPAFFDLSNHF